MHQLPAPGPELLGVSGRRKRAGHEFGQEMRSALGVMGAFKNKN